MSSGEVEQFERRRVARFLDCFSSCWIPPDDGLISRLLPFHQILFYSRAPKPVLLNIGENDNCKCRSIFPLERSESCP